MKIVIATLVVLVICSIWIILWATKSKPIIIEPLKNDTVSYGAFKQQYFANKNSKIIPKFILEHLNTINQNSILYLIMQLK